MTRYTNIGRKRTYLEAGLNDGSLKAETTSTAQKPAVQTHVEVKRKKINVCKDHSARGEDRRNELAYSKDVEAKDAESSTHVVVEAGVKTAPVSPPNNSKTKRLKNGDRKRPRRTYRRPLHHP